MSNKKMYGIRIYPHSKEELVKEIKEKIDRKEKTAIMSVNPEILMQAQKDVGVKKALMQAEYNIPDGIGTVILAKRKGIKIEERIAGYDVFIEMLTYANQHEKRLFLYGGTEEVNQKTKEKIKERYPSVKIAGATNGYRKDKEAVRDEINKSGSDFLFIAMGAPHQEIFINAYKEQLSVQLIQPVGGSFDVFSGKTKRAPEWIQKINLEWLYRMLTDLKRVKRIVKMILFITKEMVKGRGRNE